MYRFCWIFLTFFFSKFSFGQIENSTPPKYEVRAAWITTVAGLDWPQTYDTTQQKQSLRDIVVKLRAANFNTIFFQVRGRGDAMYESSYEPWSKQLTGQLGKKPSWDPLLFIIEEAHKNGMELHAWFNAFLVKSTPEKPELSSPLHVILQHPEWVYLVGNEWWLDPGIPDVRDYLIKVAMEIVHNYDIDGFQFDYIRYPGIKFPDDVTYLRYGSNQHKSDWRRENINLLISSFYDSAIAIKPMLKIGSTPIGVYVNISGVKGLQSYHEVYQDSRGWLIGKKQDYLVPQIYWSFGTQKFNPDFNLLAEDWTRNSCGRHIYIGVGAFKAEIASQLPLYIDASRKVKADGISFFRFSSIKDLLQLGGRFCFKALIPPMPWKDSIPPERPKNFKVVANNSNVYKLQWELPPPAPDRDVAKYINVYRSSNEFVDINDPRCLIATISAKQSEYLDTIVFPIVRKYYYAITSVDKGNNESIPAYEEHLGITNVLDIKKQVEYKPKIKINSIKSLPDKLFIEYELEHIARVVLKLVDLNNSDIMTLLDTTQQIGKYLTSVDISSLGKGSYRCVLRVGDYETSENFIK